jgi:DNA-binding transcriptional ArsR family regulator
LKARRPDAFAACADPTRRQILELLRDRDVLTAGEIAAEFPVSRAAVSKHLGVLRRAKLVRARARGREMDYRLTPEPLAEVYGRWLAEFLPVMEASLAELKRRAEGG